MALCEKRCGVYEFDVSVRILDKGNFYYLLSDKLSLPFSIAVLICHKLLLVTATASLFVASNCLINEWRLVFHHLLVRDELKQRWPWLYQLGVMDPVSSGEDLIIKTRKPYTISKQRERWTEEEHNRFLEALKLYGRAWQRIEEHIGTKTAVQIRSHAQKFFSKLEKEALAKGVPIGQAIDIDIPPPRPKRKPSNPYPRKTGTAATATQVGAAMASSSCCKQVLDLEAEHLPERVNGDQKAINLQNDQNDNCSEVLTLQLDANCSSISSVNGKSIQASATLSCTSREFVPSVKKTIKDNGTSNITIVKSSCTSNEKSIPGEKKDDSNCSSQTDKVQIIHDYPRPAAVRVVDGTLGICTTGIQVPVFHPLREVQGEPNIFDGTSISITAENLNNASTSAPLLFPTFHSPYPPIGPDQEEYQSFLQASSTLSSLIVSTLLQNPAAHAAASFAGTFWQFRDVERSAESPIPDQESFQSRQLNSGPSMAAIAAATVAAATAWWAANGMLPVCAPLHTAFNCPPALATQAPPMDGQVYVGKMHGDDNTDKKPPAADHENSEALNTQDSASKSQTSSSSGSEEIEEAKANAGKETLDQEKTEADKEVQDANKLKNRKQVDRSSCGSNTASSSEVETDGIKKHEKVKEDSKEADPERPTTDSSNRRSSRSSTSSSSDSWKEVSEEGRLAFQALFSREVLPQSFSPPQILQKKEQNTDDKTDDASTLDLNCHMWECSSGMQVADRTSEEIKADDEKGLLRVGGLGQAKLMMAHRTGFKPYKRCSSEANANRMMVSTTSSQGEERCSKRKCLEAEAST